MRTFLTKRKAFPFPLTVLKFPLWTESKVCPVSLFQMKRLLSEFPSLSNFATDRKLEKSNWRESVPYSKLSLDNNPCETSIVLYVAQVMLVAVNEPPPWNKGVQLPGGKFCYNDDYPKQSWNWPVANYIMRGENWAPLFKLLVAGNCIFLTFWSLKDDFWWLHYLAVRINLIWIKMESYFFRPAIKLLSNG